MINEDVFQGVGNHLTFPKNSVLRSYVFVSIRQQPSILQSSAETGAPAHTVV